MKPQELFPKWLSAHQVNSESLGRGKLDTARRWINGPQAPPSSPPRRPGSSAGSWLADEGGGRRQRNCSHLWPDFLPISFVQLLRPQVFCSLLPPRGQFQVKRNRAPWSPRLTQSLVFNASCLEEWIFFIMTFPPPELSLFILSAFSHLAASV